MIRPFADKILVKPIEREAKSTIPGFIYNEEYNTGVVVAVGPGKKIKEGKYDIMPVSVGERIRFGTMGKADGLGLREASHAGKNDGLLGELKGGAREHECYAHKRMEHEQDKM